MTHYYNEKVFLPSKQSGVGNLDSYLISKELRPGIYRIEDMDEKVQPHPWNNKHLKMYY